ncbi:MAG: PDZ domain-containing protein [Myxococcota bacterium]|jgi:C-terminal processing protease CtpA/Prc|nr:PDZ domain-containing protein [Myxococcota bacterium]
MKQNAHYYLLLLALPILTQCSETKTIESFPEQFYGLGVELEIRKESPVITFIHKKSPAEESKILVGDVIEAIDGKPTKGLTLAQVIMLVRGPLHSQIMLHLKRHQQKITVVLRRAEISKGPAGYQGATQKPVDTNE